MPTIPLRQSTSSAAPYRVGLWNIGNEEYLPTIGATRSSYYAIHEIDQYAIHYYQPGDSVKGKDLTAGEFNRAAMVIAEDLAQRLKSVERVMQSLGRSIPIALDEWSLKLPDDLPPGVAAERPAGLRSPFEAGLHGSLLTLREAVGEAAVHNLMERRPKDFGVASRTLLWAYMIGGVGIARDQVVLSPPALMLRLYSTKDTCQSLRTAVDGPRFDVERIDGFFEAKGASSLDASARSHSDGTTIDVLVVNRDLQQDLECPSVFEDATIGGNLDISVLNAPKITTWNSFEEPGRVRIETSQVSANGSELHRRLPAHSITKLTVRVE